MNLYSKILIYAVLSRGKFCREFTHFFGVLFFRSKKYVGVPKMTIMRYVHLLNKVGDLCEFMLRTHGRTEGNPRFSNRGHRADF